MWLCRTFLEKVTAKIETDNETVFGCTADINLIGDGLCDLRTNSEECGYDGGDCCLAEKSTVYCQITCDCNLNVDLDNISYLFTEYKVHLVNKSSQLQTAVSLWPRSCFWKLNGSCIFSRTGSKLMKWRMLFHFPFALKFALTKSSTFKSIPGLITLILDFAHAIG